MAFRKELRIEYNLHQPRAISEINEGKAPMVPTAMYPARQIDLLAQLLFP